jgi:hypothetical protein
MFFLNVFFHFFDPKKKKKLGGIWEIFTKFLFSQSLGGEKNKIKNKPFS